jgi:regulator of replication initiation timing
MTLPAWPPGPPSRSETVEALLAERAELIAENHTLRFKSSTLADELAALWVDHEALQAERDHLARMLNPPRER